VKTAETKPQAVAAGKSAGFEEEIASSLPISGTSTTRALPRRGERSRRKDILDDEVVPFGIREFHFDATTGFWLNGKNFKLKASACTMMAARGRGRPAARWNAAWKELKKLGVNAIRTAHNPPARSFWIFATAWAFW